MNGMKYMNIWMLILLISLLLVSLSACSTKLMYPDLILSKTVGVDAVQVGDTVEIKCQLKNDGSGPAYNVIIEPELPKGVKVKEDSLKSIPMRHIKRTLGESWRIGNMAPGESLTLTYQVVVEEAPVGEMQIKSKIRFWDAKYQDKYHTADVVLIVEAPPQFELLKSIAPDRSMPSDILTCQIVVKNSGGGEIKGIIEDQIPEGFIYQPGSLRTSPNITLDEPSGVNPLVWSISNLTSGSEVKISYELLVSESVAPGERRATITRITGATRRGEQLQAEARSNVIHILPGPKLVLKKQISSTDLAVDDSITCALTIENQGQGIARDCVIQDMMPSFFIYEDGSYTISKLGIRTNHPYQWILGDLSPGESVQITYKIKVDQAKDAVYKGYATVVYVMTETGRKLQIQSNPIEFRIANIIGKPEPHRKPIIKRENQVYIGKPQ